MKFAGIDISMSAPSFTIYDDNDGEFSFKTCKKYFLTDIKKHANDICELNIFADLVPEYNSNEERWDKISNWGMEQIKSCDYALIEGYAYGLLSEFFHAGRSLNYTGNYDSDQIEMGIKVEMEHTTDPLIAERIAKDHFVILHSFD